jgi:chitin synthase
METMAVPAHTDPFSPYRSLDAGSSPGLADKYDTFADGNLSQAALPLVSHAQGFREVNSDDEDAYHDRKSINADDDRNNSRYGSRYGDSMSNFGTDVYAPSRNMFQSLDKKSGGGEYDEKDELPSHPVGGETVEEVKESAARKRWVALCWVLTWWIPSFLLRWFGHLKRPDIRQAWREKLTINLIIWFICGCAIFVIAILGNLICPREHVYSTDELAEHNYQDQPNNAFISIRGEVSVEAPHSAKAK